MTEEKCMRENPEQHYQLWFTNLMTDDVQLIGWNYHTPNHKGKAKAWMRSGLPSVVRSYKVEVFESKFGHGWGLRVKVDAGYFSFEGHHLTEEAEREMTE